MSKICSNFTCRSESEKAYAAMGIRARLVDPAMADYGAAAEFVVRDDSPSRDLGYPWAAPMGDGRVLVVYYFCDPAGLRHIAGSVLLVE